MKLQSRTTHSFVELKVDVIEDTIFYSDEKEIERTIMNLISIISDLSRMSGKTATDFVNEYYQ